MANVAAVAEIVDAGRNNMPAFATLTAEQIRDVAAYVAEQLAGK